MSKNNVLKDELINYLREEQNKLDKELKISMVLI